MLSREEFMFYTDRALSGMVTVVGELGDERANRSAYPGANTPYTLLHHCLAVMETWAGGFVRGRTVDRDRDSEFHATGSVDELIERTRVAKAQLHRDVAAAEPEAALLSEPPREYLGPPGNLTQGAALQHVFEELAQHHGQMETLRDVLITAAQPDPATSR
ncbi:UNVERIFIED_CONTAM: uncharacterized protein DUF664 [Williamsia faeni]